MNWLILYDIRDARRLRRVEKIVSSYAWRVQKSVFESDAPKETIEIMKYRLGYAIDENEDFILIFNICEKDWQKKEKYGISCEHEIINDMFYIL